MESQPQNPEFKINPENFHPSIISLHIAKDKNIYVWLLYNAKHIIIGVGIMFFFQRMFFI